jgi:hypothetical protein
MVLVLALWVHVWISPGGDRGVCLPNVVVEGVHGAGGVRMNGTNYYGVRGGSVGGVPGVGNVHGPAIVHDTSPHVWVFDASASTLGEPSPCVSGGQTVHGEWETSVHGDGVLSLSKGKILICQPRDLRRTCRN